MHEAYQALQGTLDYCLEYLNTLAQTPVDAQVSADALKARFDQPMPEVGIDARTVIAELVKDVEGGLTASGSGRFFGWVIGGSVPASLAADWLTSTWDQVPGVYAVSPVSVVVEEVCRRWLLSLLHLPQDASIAFVTGCQMAHVTCLAAARNALLQQKNWDVEQHGLYQAPPIRVVSSSHRHGTLERALRMLGMGRAHIIDIPVDELGQLTATALESVLSADPDAPTIVLLQAGNVNTGVFDPFDDVIPIAHKYNAWVHVDGAFGLWAAASPEYRHLTAGVERADSWATDGHKWLNVPYDCGYAFVAHPEAQKRAFSHAASYLHQSNEQRDPVDWSPEHSRRARGFATYAALKSLGRQGVAELVERCCQHAKSIVEKAAAIPHVEAIYSPIINQGLIRFLDNRAEATAAHHDRRTKEVIAAINASGEALFTGTTWKGMQCMRVSVSNWQTSENDVERALQAIAEASNRV